MANYHCILLLVLQIGVIQGLGCRNGWLSFNNSCYLFSKTQVDWPDAVTICHAMKSHLVEIDTKEEDSFVRTTLLGFQAQGSVQTNGYWIGMSDIEISHSWRWITSDRSLSYSNWHPGQPDDRPDEDCGVLWTTQGFEWGDEFCNDKAVAFICESEAGIVTEEIVGK